MMDPAEVALYERLRRGGVSERTLRAMAAAPRVLFAPAGAEDRAWADEPLALPAGQTVSQPYVVGRMCDLLRLDGDERVLDVGTGSGWHAAVLARLAAHVWSIERHARLSALAERHLRDAGIDNVTLVVGDGAAGLPARAPFDAINVAAACRHRVPPALLEQLADGGRLVAPVDGHLWQIARHGDRLRRTRQEGVRFVPLVSDAG